MSTHTPGPCDRREQPIYCGKGYKAKFVCPICGRSTYQSLNFLGRRIVICNGTKFTKEAKECV